jgi:hypothetical protein
MCSQDMSGGLGRSCVLSEILLDLETPIVNGAEVTYVFESVGVGFGVILQEVACHRLILEFLAATSHFVVL